MTFPDTDENVSNFSLDQNFDFGKKQNARKAEQERNVKLDIK